MKKIIVAFTLSLFFFTAGNVMAQSAEEVMKKAHLAAYYAGDDGVSQLLMKVYSKGSKRPLKKLFFMMKKDLREGGKQLFMTYFVKPSDIKRTTFLVHKYIDQDDFRRLYIPASDKVLAIAGSRKQDPFMGSDFSYEDVSGRHYSKDNHKLVGEDKVKGKATYVIESTPKEEENKIAKIKYWIDKSNFVPVKVDFYNHEGEVYKIYESGKVATIKGYPTILVRTMTSPKEGTKTIILVNPKKTTYDVGLKESDFTERSLKNPPTKYFR